LEDPTVEHAVKWAPQEHPDLVRVHPSLVLSGKNFLKDEATKRDLRRGYPKAQAVEMEGSALSDVCYWMGDFAFAIRDMSTVEKDKTWQGYAAITAAAVLNSLINKLSE
jgi:nucleoside phosphorylase